MSSTRSELPEQQAGLLPCPFCGGEAIPSGTGEHVGNPASVRCAKCHACVGYHRPKSAAIAAWNRRAPESEPKPLEAMGATVIEGWARNEVEPNCSCAGAQTIEFNTACGHDGGAWGVRATLIIQSLAHPDGIKP